MGPDGLFLLFKVYFIPKKIWNNKTVPPPILHPQASLPGYMLEHILVKFDKPQLVTQQEGVLTTVVAQYTKEHCRLQLYKN